MLLFNRRLLPVASKLYPSLYKNIYNIQKQGLKVIVNKEPNGASQVIVDDGDNTNSKSIPKPIVKKIEPKVASKIVLLDYILTNVDRTPRNTNMLMWHKELWLIDHGASLYFHHSWENWEEQSKRVFSAIKDHVLLAQASEIEAVVEEFCATLTPELINDVVNLIPNEWLSDYSVLDSPDERRQVYAQFIETRVKMIDSVIKEIENARKSTI